MVFGFWFLLFVSGDAALCLRLKEVHIPSHTVVNSTVRFECHYDLDGEALYSVKWYKELNEFYRYVPRDFPAAHVFSLPGIHVNVQYNLIMANANYHSDPKTLERIKKHCDTFIFDFNSCKTPPIRYSYWRTLASKHLADIDAKCLARLHHFKRSPNTATWSSLVSPQPKCRDWIFWKFYWISMFVVACAVVLPEEGPQITGGRPVYQIDDQVNVNCTSGRSKPATDLMWFINGKEAPPAYLRYYEKQRSNDFDGLETTTLGLKFPVTVDSFNKGNMKLKVRPSHIIYCIYKYFWNEIAFTQIFVDDFIFYSSVWQQSRPFTGRAMREIWRARKIKLVDRPDSEIVWELIEFKVTFYFYSYFCPFSILFCSLFHPDIFQHKTVQQALPKTVWLSYRWHLSTYWSFRKFLRRLWIKTCAPHST